MEDRMKNLWEKDRKAVFREFYHQYLDEGYSHKEAKKLAKEEADELYGEAVEFAFEVADAEHNYD